MRFRLFAFISLVLTVVAVCSTLLDNHFVNEERIEYIDRELAEVSSALVRSELATLSGGDRDRIEEVISRTLGVDRYGKIIVIRDAKGGIEFQSGNLRVLPLSEVPIGPESATVRVDDKFLRVRNTRLPDGRTLQAGYVADETLVLNRALARRDFYEILSLVVIGLLVAWSLARKLLRPISRLAGEVNLRSRLAATSSRIPELASPPRAPPGDEFASLVNDLNALIARVNRGYELSRTWSYRMAHELKTPMAVLSAEFGRAEAARKIPAETAALIQSEIAQMSDTISAFLAWAEAETVSVRKNLKVVRTGDLASAVGSRFETMSRGRLHVRVNSSVRVATSPIYAEMVLSNLVSNALKYADPGTPVELRVDGPRIAVTNLGPPIPEEVLARIGEPFNRSSTERKEEGHGLGLATIHAVARAFEWPIAFERLGGRTQVRVDLSSSLVDEELPDSAASPTRRTGAENRFGLRS